MKTAGDPQRLQKVVSWRRRLEVLSPGVAPLHRGRPHEGQVGEPEVDRVPHRDQEQDGEQPERRRQQRQAAPLEALLVLARLPELGRGRAR